MKERIYLSPPHMGSREKELANEAFESNWIAPLGPHVDAFEQEVARYINSNGAVASNSGTAALHLALKLVGVSTGDYVFCSTLTFVASANPILYEKAIPVFIDSDESTWNMSASALERALHETKKQNHLPKAIIIVNLYGQSADYDQLLGLARQYRIPVIEDAAESLGATYGEFSSGTLGDYGVFSFNGNKIITTSGGGMLVSNNLDGLAKARFWSTQSRELAPYYLHEQVGYNYRMSNLVAAVGRGQLAVLMDRVTRRREIFERYYNELSDFPGVSFMPEANYGTSNRWLTVMTIDRTDITPTFIIESLSQENIEARHVWKPLHTQPLFKGCSYYSDQLGRSVSEVLFKQGVCLPSGSSMTDEDQTRVINCINETLKSKI